MDSAVAQLKSASRAVVQDLVDDAEGTGVTSYEIDDQELVDIRAVAQGELESGDTTLINDTVHGCGIEEAVRVYGDGLIRRAHQLDALARSTHTAHHLRRLKEAPIMTDTAPVSAQQDAASGPSGVDLARLALFQARQDAKQRGNDRPKCTPPPEEGSHPVPRARAGRAAGSSGA